MMGLVLRMIFTGGVAVGIACFTKKTHTTGPSLPPAGGFVEVETAYNAYMERFEACNYSPYSKVCPSNSLMVFEPSVVAGPCSPTGCLHLYALPAALELQVSWKISGENREEMNTASIRFFLSPTHNLPQRRDRQVVSFLSHPCVTKSTSSATTT